MTRIIFDTETTGLNPRRDEILDIAIIDGDGDTLHTGLYKPSRATSWPEAAAVNGIWPEDVADCPPINRDVDLIKGIIENSDEIVGYNVGFDLGFLAALGIKPRADAVIIDTMIGYAPVHGDWNDYYEDFTWCKLTVAAREIGYKWTGAAHGALADALATRAVQEWLEALDDDIPLA